MQKILLLIMLVVMVGCSGPSNKDTCIPSNDKGGKGGQSAQGGGGEDDSQVANAEEIDKKLRDAKIITNIVNKIKQEVIGGGISFGGAQALFTGFVMSPMIQTGVIAAFVLYVMIFGIMVIGGMINVSLNELIIRMVKVSFITIFAMNWGDFYGLIGQASLSFTDEMLGYFLNTFQGKFSVGGMGINIQENVFTKLDYFIAKMFGMKMMALLSALFLASGSSGPIYALLILVAIFFVFKDRKSVV